MSEENEILTVKNDQPERSWLKQVERYFSLLANISVVIGIAFALYQIHQSNAFEERRTAIAAINQTRSSDFLKSYRSLKTAYETNQLADEERDALIDSLNHVMNVYDNIAILYINDLVDRCIVNDAVYSGAKEMATICNALKYPPEYRQQFDLFISLMEKEACNKKTVTPQLANRR